MFLLTTFEFLVGNHLVPIRGTGVRPNVIVAASNPPEDQQLSRAITMVLQKADTIQPTPQPCQVRGDSQPTRLSHSRGLQRGEFWQAGCYTTSY
jgi:hypothetical protein